MTYDYTIALEGEHTYRFKAVDAAGNESEESDLFTVKRDKAKPAPGKTDASFAGEKDGVITGLLSGTAYEYRVKESSGSFGT